MFKDSNVLQHNTCKLGHRVFWIIYHLDRILGTFFKVLNSRSYQTYFWIWPRIKYFVFFKMRVFCFLWIRADITRLEFLFCFIVFVIYVIFLIAGSSSFESQKMERPSLNVLSPSSPGMLRDAPQLMPGRLLVSWGSLIGSVSLSVHL